MDFLLTDRTKFEIIDKKFCFFYYFDWVLVIEIFSPNLVVRCLVRAVALNIR